MRNPRPFNPPLIAAAMACACLASFVIGLALPLPSPRFALVSPDGATLAQGLAPQACRAMLAEYPQGMGWTCL